MSDEVKILEIAPQKMAAAMDELITDCLDESGKPKSPSMQVLMRSRGLLPPYCKQSLSKKQILKTNNFISNDDAIIKTKHTS